MNNIVCLKWGEKYSSEFPNRLLRMLRKQCNSDFTLYCCTEDSSGIDPDIKVIPLPNYDIESYWWKLWIHSNEFPINGKLIFLDLDIVIQNDIQLIFDYDPLDKLCVLNTIWKDSGINSSIMCWDNTKYKDMIFKSYMTDPEYYMLKYRGNDDLLESIGGYATLPTDWVYARVWGYDRSDITRHSRAVDSYKNANSVEYMLYRMPERMICLFNGIDNGQGMDSGIYRGFEHYWSD